MLGMSLEKEKNKLAGFRFHKERKAAGNEPLFGKEGKGFWSFCARRKGKKIASCGDSCLYQGEKYDDYQRRGRKR